MARYKAKHSRKRAKRETRREHLRAGVVLPVTAALAVAVSPATAAWASHYVPPNVAVVLGHEKTLGQARAAQARAIQYADLASAEVEQTGPASFEVVLPDVAGYKVARTIKTAELADFVHVSIESPQKLSEGRLLPGSPSGYLPSVEAQSSAPSEQATPGSQTASGGQANAYTVRPGDCLWTIAGTKLSDPYRWPQIASLNHLSNPNLIFPEQQLELPS